jgi:hypothetical protein
MTNFEPDKTMHGLGFLRTIAVLNVDYRPHGYTHTADYALNLYHFKGHL